MAVSFNQVFFPQNWDELFHLWSRTPDAVPFAGGVQFFRFQGTRTPVLPHNLLSLDRIEELRRITRTEQYLEVGAMVCLNEIIRLGTIVPEILRKCLEGIAGLQVRNTATIGGNICSKGRYMDSCAALIALDARYELRTATATRWIAASRFSPASLASGELLTRIRIPLEPWNYSLCKKIRRTDMTNQDNIERDAGVIVFLLRNQKNILTNIKIVFAGNIVLEDRNIERLLIGTPLPLSRKAALTLIAQWEAYLSTLGFEDGLVRSELLNFIETSLLGLTE
jgi:CO/xanthine dehydrogenase FAD-binding subunit